jgi:carbon-monoxide dehydrogenase small subunit
MLISVWDILGRTPECTEAELRIAPSGNLCRCTGYQGIVRSAPRAAKQRNAGNEVREE